MAVITNLNQYPIVPSDVFGWEVNTDVGYGRETYTLTLEAGKMAHVGSVFVLDEVARTAVLAKATDASAPEGKTFGIFVGRDTTTNPAVYNDFDRLTAKETGLKVVAITRGDGRGTLRKANLEFDGTYFYDLPEASQKAMVAHFNLENRFKVTDQTV